MLTRSSIRGADPLDLFRALGYPIAPVDVDPDEWRRGGVTIPWNGTTRLQLVARMRRFDLFLLTGNVAEEAISIFLHNYYAYNQLTKSALIYQCDQRLSIFDLHERGVRRLDLDLHDPTPHAVDRLNLLAHNGDDTDLRRMFDRALDRENVTRQFFQRFRGAVQDVASALAQALPHEPREQCDGEALLILSRLLFLSFVQEKGWLNRERRFLVDRLDACVREGREFFATVLLPLFFGCLNTPLHARTIAARLLGRIPYLNGGLFEPSAFEQKHTDLHLPNALLANVLENVFEKFDFSIDEGDPAGTHVDPEMLGKVFESLMAEDERAESGSFYTPKEIVDVLTQRAIDEWLGDEPSLEKLERITVLDPACGSGAFLLSALAAIERKYAALTNDVPRDLRQRIVERSLFGVDQKPEAVRLCELRLWLAIVAVSDADIERVQPLPNLDRNILQGNSLLSPTDFLGDARADIYRDWLQAIRAQRDVIERYRSAPREHRPVLYRIIRGNDQRLASELLARAIDVDERELQLESAPRRDLFGRAVPSDMEHCRELQQRIAENRRMLDKVEEGSLDFFSFDIHFAHVLAAGGFDVVAGNPPWVRNSRIDPRTKRMVAERFTLFRAHRDGTAFHQPDLSVAFFERALGLVSKGGVVAMLMPSKIAGAAYAAPLRRHLAERTSIVAIDDWSDDPRRRRWFEADTFPMGVVVRNGEPPLLRSHPLPRAGEGRREASGEGLPTITITACGESFTVEQQQLPVDGAASEWALVPNDVAAILSRLRRHHPPLSQALGRKPLMGVKTGDNRSFFLVAKKIKGDKLVTEDGIEVPLTAVCRCIRGRDVRRWRVEQSHWMLWPPREGWSKPPRWLQQLAEARELEPADFQLSFVRAEHVGIKVAWKDLSRGMAAAVLPDVVHVDGRAFPLVPNQTLYSLDAVSLDEAYVMTAILNSVVMDALLVCVAERAKDGHYRYFGRTVARVPWPDATPLHDKLLRLSRRAHMGDDEGASGGRARPAARLATGSAAGAALNTFAATPYAEPVASRAAGRARPPVALPVDLLVAKLYGVNDAELALLRAFVARRLGAR